MNNKKNYLIAIDGNEALLERFVAAIEAGTCKVAGNYPNPYVLPTGERFLDSSVINYFFQSQPFLLESAIAFVEKLRKLSGFKSYSYTVGKWIEARITGKFYNLTKDKREVVKSQSLKPHVALTAEEKEILSFICYMAVSHLKYGASYESVTAGRYFDMVTALGSEEVVKLKKEGTGTLPKTLTGFKDADLVAKANDAFATINIKLLASTEEAYRKALLFINNLLQTDFPKSFSILLQAAEKVVLPIKGLPKAGPHYLFAGAVKFPGLHPHIETYIKLAQKEDEWYNQLEEENCALPATFAVFALGLEGPQYFNTVIRYLQTVDAEHQLIQEKFTPAFLQKWGVTEVSVKVYINCILSMQEHPHHKLFGELFGEEKGLELLLQSKCHFSDWYFTAANKETFKESGSEISKMADYCWQSVLYTTFGDSKTWHKIAKRMSAGARALFEQLQLEPGQ